jgi:hypothetical protein
VLSHAGASSIPHLKLEQGLGLPRPELLHQLLLLLGFPARVTMGAFRPYHGCIKRWKVVHYEVRPSLLALHVHYGRHSVNPWRGRGYAHLAFSSSSSSSFLSAPGGITLSPSAAIPIATTPVQGEESFLLRGPRSDETEHSWGDRAQNLVWLGCMDGERSSAFWAGENVSCLLAFLPRSAFPPH